jgi:hypothetical protein
MPVEARLHITTRGASIPGAEYETEWGSRIVRDGGVEEAFSCSLVLVLG